MFCHLHIHSEYSILQSSIKLENLVEKAALCRMKSIALTDYSVMHGAVNFYKKTMQSGIKPIIGIELLLYEKDYLPYNIILLAKGFDGYKNLCKISSFINLKSKNERKYVCFENIQDICRDVICIIGYESNLITSLLIKNNSEEAEKIVRKWSEIFKEDLFFEIIRKKSDNPKNKHIYAASEKYIENVIESFAEKESIGIVAANNVSFLSKEDYPSFKTLLKIYSMSSKKTPPFSKKDGFEEYYFKTPSEMKILFNDLPEALANTVKISEKCNLEIGLSKMITQGIDSQAGSMDNENKQLRNICYRKACIKYKGNYNDNIKKRLDHELKVIEKTGFSRYFLIAADIAEYAKKNHIPIYGKGSSAGSIVTYMLGISNIDPVINNLSFERFLHEQRKKLPDIDIDISSTGRFKIINYLSLKYGRMNIIRIPVFATIRSRSSLREAGRVLNLSRQEIQSAINDCYPEKHGKKPAIKESGTSFSDEDFLRASSCISGYIRHLSMHPCAFVIIDKEHSGIMPLMISETGDVMSQYPSENIEDMGLLKIDLINSVTLDHISYVSEILAERRGIDMDFLKIPRNDRRVYEMLKEGNSICVFQLESMGIRSLMKKLKPSSIEDITLLISLYRPGPQQSGMVDTFIRRKFQEEPVDYMHYDLKDILKDTCGVMLYQEQVMKVAEKIAGYSPGEADRLRKAIVSLSKKAMENEKAGFLKGSFRKGYGHELSVGIFDLIAKFAGYGFVKAHAASYADISYITAYIKSYFPAELISSILTRNSGYYGRGSYIEEARRLGIAIKPPDINIASDRYLTENNGRSLMVSLSSVRDLGPEGVKEIISERNNNGKYKSFFDFFERIVKKRKISIKAAKNLIDIGAFDFTGLKRKYLAIILEYLLSIKSRRDICINSIFDKYIECMDGFFPEISNYMPDYSNDEKIEIENDLLGFCISANPLDYFKDITKDLNITESGCFKKNVSIKRPIKNNIISEGFVLIKRRDTAKSSRSGKEIIFLTLEDRDGMYEAVSFSEASVKACKQIKAGTPVLIKGSLIFKKNDIYVKISHIKSLADLKKTKENSLKQALKIHIMSKQ
ncbi:MAG: DNA polymerase III subunit alpha [Actinomycetota bacterium]|nr:DNA polymerase III subunit alpha [Actinomycetota bacterium]